MSASGCWCALILLTFTQDSLGSHYEKLLQLEKPKEYLRHQQNHRSSTYVDRKLVAEQPVEFRATEIRSTLDSPTIVEIACARIEEENRRAEIHPIPRNRATSQSMNIRSAIVVPIRPADSENRLKRAENRPEEIRSPTKNLVAVRAEMHSHGNHRAMTIRSVEISPAEIAFGPGKVRAAEKRLLRIHPTETRSQAEDRRSAEEISPTEFRPMETPWTEMEQAEASSVERSQIRHGRSRSHFARPKIEESAKDNAKDAVNRIKAGVRDDRENHSKKSYQAEKASDFSEGSVSLKRNHSWLSGQNFSKDNSISGQSLDRIEDNVPEGLENLLKLYQARKGSVAKEGSIVPLTRNLSWLIEQNFFKNNTAIGRSSDYIKDEAQANPDDTSRAHQPDNQGILRSSPDSLKSLFKDDPLNKLRKAIFSNKTIVPPVAIDRSNTTETLGVDPTENASESSHDLDEEILQDVLDYTSYEETTNVTSDRSLARRKPQAAQVDIVTRFLRIIENQHTLGENCTAGTDLNLGEGVVDQYAQERFRLEAEFAVNRANMLTRLWKYAPEVMLSSEYLLHASVLSMVEFDEDIFAAGNCYDKLQYRDRWLYCPFAHRLPNQDGVLVKDLAIQYKYLSNSSEWFYIARKNAERVIASYEQFSRGESSILSLSLIYYNNNNDMINQRIRNLIPASTRYT